MLLHKHYTGQWGVPCMMISYHCRVKAADSELHLLNYFKRLDDFSLNILLHKACVRKHHLKTLTQKPEMQKNRATQKSKKLTT